MANYKLYDAEYGFLTGVLSVDGIRDYIANQYTIDCDTSMEEYIEYRKELDGMTDNELIKLINDLFPYNAIEV